ncbi:MAG: hypothetical protein VYC31_03800, partial [Pseudomonadota bacterium]|nr:hypothetical protein [Pseudomonadota bacterium]
MFAIDLHSHLVRVKIYLVKTPDQDKPMIIRFCDSALWRYLMAAPYPVASAPPPPRPRPQNPQP